MAELPTGNKRSLLFLILAMLLVCAASLRVGPMATDWATVWHGLLGNAEAQYVLLVRDVRLPRLVLGLMVGSGLGVAGLVLQGLLGNPLAGPYTLGFSGGGAFGASLMILLGLGGMWVMFGAVGGVALCVVGLWLLAGRRNFSPRDMVLAGIVVGAIFSALLSLVKVVSGDSLTAIVFWILGSLSGRGWREVSLLLPFWLVGLTGIVLRIGVLDSLSLGDEFAHSAGVDVGRSRRLLLLYVSLLTGGCVAVSGVIGFVGLVVPHCLRMLMGPVHQRLIFPVIVGGGGLLVLGDMGSRWLGRYGDVPVGVLMALLGGPFFCWLLLYSNRETMGEG